MVGASACDTSGMQLKISVSVETASWLRDQARLSGETEAAFAGRALDGLAHQIAPAPRPQEPRTEDWMRRFDDIIGTLKGQRGSVAPGRGSASR